MSRERYWGLYDVGQRQWLDVDHEWKTKPVKPRMRHETIYEAMGFLENGKYPRCIVPRPFYVVRKPKSRELPAEAQAVIDAARSMSELLSVGAVGSLSYEFHQSIKKYDASR